MRIVLEASPGAQDGSSEASLSPLQEDFSRRALTKTVPFGAYVTWPNLVSVDGDCLTKESSYRAMVPPCEVIPNGVPRGKKSAGKVRKVLSGFSSARSVHYSSPIYPCNHRMLNP
ncbi:unnamed protein product [Trichogramma brassicae]|uniref:Uncharacterized protein n=1 Tax=Trichogramma brassicae TaxID=86971 RepID=A0A6H5I2T6_9HYME|nr:unnamed protein product [Trichogramma brassicae]